MRDLLAELQAHPDVIGLLRQLRVATAYTAQPDGTVSRIRVYDGFDDENPLAPSEDCDPVLVATVGGDDEHGWWWTTALEDEGELYDTAEEAEAAADQHLLPDGWVLR